VRQPFLVYRSLFLTKRRLRSNNHHVRSRSIASFRPAADYVQCSPINGHPLG
jgi:hypothetical protein